MGRPLRIEYEGAIYHVLSRGNERKEIFKDSDDKEKFLSILTEYHDRYGIIIHSYVLMNNHYHVLLETPKANLVRVMHGLNSRYTGYFNKKYSRSGHLFQGRYKAIIVDKEKYLVELSRYIHLNPIRAGIVESPELYKWSSYTGFISKKKELRWMEYKWTLSNFSIVDSKSRKKYKEFVREGINNKIENPMNKVIGQIVLGGEELLEKVRKLARKEGRLVEDVVEIKRLESYPSVDRIIEIVSTEFGVNEYYIKNKERKENTARNTAISIIKKYSGKTNKEIGEMFGGLHYSSVNRAEERLRDKMNKDKKLKDRVKRIESHIKT